MLVAVALRIRDMSSEGQRISPDPGWNNATAFPLSKMMFFQSPLGQQRVWLMPIIAVCVALAGCIADPVTPFQVRPETVVAPQNPFFQAINYKQYSTPPSGNMLVKWNRSLADTQLNFKGYFVQLQLADTNGFYINQTDSLEKIVDTATILRPYSLPGQPVKLTDTFCTFTSLIGAAPNSGLPEGTYAVTVWSEKTSTKDTTIKSVDFSQYVALFDPLPMQNPTNLEATSTGSQTVLLRWTLPVTDKDTGFFRYVIYYRDTTLQHDTGHVAITAPKGTNTALVSVPPATGTAVTATEWPYEFWIKSQRNDSTFFYGPDMYGPDTNHIVWSGAELVPKSGNDSSSGNSGFLQVLNGKSMYFGSLNNQWDVSEDSTDNTGQVVVSIAPDSVVTLTVQSHNGNLGGVGFMNRMDMDSVLDSVFYSGPLNDPSQFTQTNIQLPHYPSKGGVIVYLMMNDDQQTLLGHQWARILIHAQPNGTFINSGGIDVKGSFQPGVSLGGGQHLPFY